MYSNTCINNWGKKQLFLLNVNLCVVDKLRAQNG
jgi:hypothetical protein